MSNFKSVTIIIPCRNEENFIRQCLESVINNDFPKKNLEVLVIDGQSDDRTREIIQDYEQRITYLRLLDNSQKIVPTALNIGINHAKGDIIIRMDAHNIYPQDYISGLVYWLEKTGADNVGGVWHTRAANETARAQAIALALSHPFGVGNAHFRLSPKSPMSVDTVPFGCYRREVFDHIGKFDEELVRNQDDEFNLRLIKHGGRIILVPGIVSYYYARDSLKKLWSMYYQYGYFKPLVARKIGSIMTVRQLIPAIFVLSLIITAISGILFPSALKAFVVIAGCYGATNLIFSSSTSLEKGIKTSLSMLLVFPVLHLSYGLGFLKGIIDFWLLKHKGAKDIVGIPLTR